MGSNLFNYIALPNTGGHRWITKALHSGLPTCTGLNHTGCTYTTNGQAYPDRNQSVGPSYWNLDMNFYKTFRLTERFGLQFRGEFYNIFNHHNQYVTSDNLDVSSLSTPYIQTEKGGIYGDGWAGYRRASQHPVRTEADVLDANPAQPLIGEPGNGLPILFLVVVVECVRCGAGDEDA